MSVFGPSIDEIRVTIREIINGGEDSHAEKMKLSKEIDGLKRQIADLEHKKSLEEREIEHLVKMKEEKIAIETEKQRLDLQAKFDEKVMSLQKDYHEKVLALLKEEHDKMQEIYQQIMTRLPNVNMTIRKEA